MSPMISHVLAPSTHDLDAARRVIAEHLVATPTVTLDVRGRFAAAKLEGLQVTGSL
ncbi:MAG: hypothetical protein ACRDV0_04115 [Acidimicrobiales bacterium]